MKKRFLYCLLAFVMVLQVAPIHSLATNSYIKSENMLIQEIENQRLQSIEDIKAQLIDQDRLDHLDFYVNEISRFAESDKAFVRNNFNSSNIQSSNTLARNGGVAVNKNSYATSSYVFIPNKDINNVISQNSGLLSWAGDFTLSIIPIYGKIATTLLSLIRAINTSLLYKFRDEGSSVIKMSYIDHTEADRGSGGYVRWNSYPYITSSFQHVKAYR